MLSEDDQENQRPKPIPVPYSFDARSKDGEAAPKRVRVYCPRCEVRVSRDTLRCPHCHFAMPDTPLDLEIRFKKRVAMLVAVFAGVVALAVSFADQYVPAVSNWTTTQVVHRSPDKALSVVMMGDDERAFYTCARQVVRRLGESSIATFSARSEASTLTLGANRFLVRSQFNESDMQGNTQRRVFNCTIRLEGERWVIEELQVWSVGSAPADAPQVPAITKS